MAEQQQQQQTPPPAAPTTSTTTIITTSPPKADGGGGMMDAILQTAKEGNGQRPSNYALLMTLATKVATMDAKIDVALAIALRVDQQEARIRTIELAQGALTAQRGAWGQVGAFLWGLILALIGAGLFTKFLT